MDDPPPPPFRRTAVVGVAAVMAGLVCSAVGLVVARSGQDSTWSPSSSTPGGPAAVAPAATGVGADPTPPARAAAPVVVALPAPVRTLNPHRADLDEGARRAAVAAANQVFPSVFVHYPDGSWLLDRTIVDRVDALGPAPTEVRYHLAAGARWSDGTAIGCDDFALAWNAISGRVPSFSTARTERPVARNPETVTYQAVAGVDCAGADVTVRFSRPVADWRMLFAHLLPAHAVAAVAGVTGLSGALIMGDLRRLAPVAAVWDDGFGTGLDPRLLVSAGPFVVSDVLKSGEVRLGRNASYPGPPAGVDQLVLRPITDASGVLAALRRGGVQVAETGPNEDFYRQLGLLADYRVDARPAAGYVELSFLFPFNSSGLGDPHLAEPGVRRAIAWCVDRPAIARDLLGAFVDPPPTADSHLVAPGQPGYSPGIGRFATRDVGAARAELEAVGWTAGPDGVYQRNGERLSVRLVHDRAPRETRLAVAVASACAEAGIEVVPVPTGATRVDGGLRVQAWGPYASVEAQLSRFEAGGALNNSFYQDPALAPLADGVRAHAGDPVALAAATAAADAELWENGASVPLYPLVTVSTWDTALCGVDPNPTELGLTWNAGRWYRCDAPRTAAGGTR